MLSVFYSLLNLGLIITSFTQAFDRNIADVSVWLSGAAYCEKSYYENMTLTGPAEGFKYIDTLYDVKTDTQGFIGYQKSSKSIYVVIRGTNSVLNWLDDIEMLQSPYTTYPECNCNVHTGFYKSALSVKERALFLVDRLHQKYPDYNIITTGHSFGAATSALLAMELSKLKLSTPPIIQVYNFGQPRIGDMNYAHFVNTIIPTYWRFTHNQDIVPHLPIGSVIEYLHSCREVFEDVDGGLKECSATDCEDMSCANQYSIKDTNVDDHHAYLGHTFSCEESTIYSSSSSTD